MPVDALLAVLFAGLVCDLEESSPYEIPAADKLSPVFALPIHWLIA